MSLVNPKVFEQGLEMIVQVFGDNAIRGPRLARIKSICEGRISDKGFIEICNIICDNFRSVPLPNDFDKAINDWNKAYFAKNGKRYFDEERAIEVQYVKIDCEKCNDLGLVVITH